MKILDEDKEKEPFNFVRSSSVESTTQRPSWSCMKMTRTQPQHRERGKILQINVHYHNHLINYKLVTYQTRQSEIIYKILQALRGSDF